MRNQKKNFFNPSPSFFLGWPQFLSIHSEDPISELLVWDPFLVICQMFQDSISLQLASPYNVSLLCSTSFWIIFCWFLQHPNGFQTLVWKLIILSNICLHFQFPLPLCNRNPNSLKREIFLLTKLCPGLQIWPEMLRLKSRVSTYL